MARLYSRRRTLTPSDRRTVHALAEAMFSDGESAVANARLEAHVEAVDEMLSAASWTVRFGLRAALLFVSLSPLFLTRRFRRITSLPLGERVSLLATLEHMQSNLALAFVGWRSVMTLLYYEDEGELRRMGYAAERKRHLRLLPIAEESGVRLKSGTAHEEEEVA